MRPPLPPGPYLVVGLARSGVAAARVLAARGDEVIAVDTGAVDVDLPGIEVITQSDGVALLERVRVLIKSPGVPKEAPVVAAARARGMPVLGEAELAWRLLPNPWIAVTGSNGKTTTVELIGHIHREAGVPVAVAGNVGTALSGLVGQVGDDVVIVAEVSSFQLEDTEAFAPDTAVLLNISDDHLDRHGTLADYAAAKLRVFAHQAADAVAVLPVGFGGAAGAARRVTFGAGGDVAVGGHEVALRGAHNLENASAAAAVCLARGIDPDAVARGLRTFTGVPHRLEEIAEQDGVLYVNDSKATNVASAVVGIASFPAGVHAILGGRGKGGDYAPLAAAVGDRVRAAYLIGEASAELAVALAGSGVPLLLCGDLARAVDRAREAARPGEVVLLAPACTSFDQYSSFEERGEHFRRLVLGEG